MSGPVYETLYQFSRSLTDDHIDEDQSEVETGNNRTVQCQAVHARGKLDGRAVVVSYHSHYFLAARGYHYIPNVHSKCSSPATTSSSRASVAPVLSPTSSPEWFGGGGRRGDPDPIFDVSPDRRPARRRPRRLHPPRLHRPARRPQQSRPLPQGPGPGRHRLTALFHGTHYRSSLPRLQAIVHDVAALRRRSDRETSASDMSPETSHSRQLRSASPRPHSWPHRALADPRRPRSTCPERRITLPTPRPASLSHHSHAHASAQARTSIVTAHDRRSSGPHAVSSTSPPVPRHAHVRPLAQPAHPRQRRLLLRPTAARPAPPNAPAGTTAAAPPSLLPGGSCGRLDHQRRVLDPAAAVDRQLLAAAAPRLHVACSWCHTFPPPGSCPGRATGRPTR